MKSNIGFKNLKVPCVIGVFPEERTITQVLLVDVSVLYDVSNAASSDDLSDTINYVEIAEFVQKTAIQGKYKLIEALMVDCLKGILKLSLNIEKASITIKKPPALEDADYTFSEMELVR